MHDTCMGNSGSAGAVRGLTVGSIEVKDTHQVELGEAAADFWRIQLDDSGLRSYFRDAHPDQVMAKVITTFWKVLEQEGRSKYRDCPDLLEAKIYTEVDLLTGKEQWQGLLKLVTKTTKDWMCLQDVAQMLGWVKDDPNDTAYNMMAIDVPTGVSLHRFMEDNNIKKAAVLGRSEEKRNQRNNNWRKEGPIKVDIVFEVEDQKERWGFLCEGVKAGLKKGIAVKEWEPPVDCDICFYILGADMHRQYELQQLSLALKKD